MRRSSRECALQVLYQLDLNDDLSAELGADSDKLTSALNAFWLSFDRKKPVDREYTERLVQGVVSNLEALDRAIGEISSQWKVGRMGKVDRNLIRLAGYEIQRCPDIPVGVSINEALEIAKRFSTHESVGFINGVLDALAKRVDAAEEPATEA